MSEAKRVSYYLAAALCEVYKANLGRLKRSHGHELVAAYFGYNTAIAMRADKNFKTLQPATRQAQSDISRRAACLSMGVYYGASHCVQALDHHLTQYLQENATHGINHT